MEEKKDKALEYFNCLNCRRTLCREAIFWGKIEIICPSCGTTNEFERTPDLGEGELLVRIKKPKKKIKKENNGRGKKD